MKCLPTVLLVLVLFAPASYAQPLQFPRPPQAPAVKKAKAEPCPCTGKADCTCDPAACFCRACSGRKAGQSETGIVQQIKSLNPQDAKAPIWIKLSSSDTEFLMYPDAEITLDGKGAVGKDVLAWLPYKTILATLHPNPRFYGAVDRAEFTNSHRKTVKTVDCGCLRGGLCRCPVSTGCHCDTIPGQDSKATTYTGTLNLAYTLPAGSHGWGLRYSVITDTDIPAGTYMLTAVPKATTRVNCRCGSDPLLCSCTQGECQCHNGKPCTMYPVPQNSLKYDTTIIYRCPETGRRWRYVDQEGNWSVVPELPPVQYQPAPQFQQSQFVPMSFGSGGAVRGGSC